MPDREFIRDVQRMFPGMTRQEIYDAMWFASLDESVHKFVAKSPWFKDINHPTQLRERLLEIFKLRK